MTSLCFGLGLSLLVGSACSSRKVAEPAPPPAPAPSEEPAPFRWTVTVDGKARPLTALEGELPIPVEGWSCGFGVDPVERADGAIEQFGALDCRHLGSRAVADAIVLCRTDADTPTDHGSANLQIVGAGRAAFLELTCISSTRESTRPPLGGPRGAVARSAAAAPGGASDPVPHQAGRFVWKLERGGTLDPAGAGWACERALRPVKDLTYGYAELGELRCQREGVTVSRWLPCTRPTGAAPTCQLGALRVADATGELASFSLLCKSVGHPGCFTE